MPFINKTFIGSTQSTLIITAGENLSQYDVVYVSTDGKYYKAINNGTAAQSSACGIVTQSGGIAQNATGQITKVGFVTNNSWSFAIGPVYLSTSGAITSTEPTTQDTYWVPLGNAETATQIFFNPGTGIKINAARPVLTGTQANRPVASVANRIYLPSDGYYMSIDSGSAWSNYVNGFQCTKPPAASTFTAVNAADATLVDEADCLVGTLMGTNSGSEKVEVFLTSLPSAPYSFVVGIEFLWLYPLSYSMAGICLTNGTSTSNKLLWMGLMQLTTVVDLAIQKHSAFSTWDSNYLDIAACPPLTSGRIFFKISDDNSSRHFYMSQDGRIFTEVMASHSRTDFLTATHAGISLGQVTGSVATTLTRAKMRIFHWSLA